MAARPVSQMGVPTPQILFVQHGWHDTNRSISQLGQRLADGQTVVIAPDLGLLRTWWRMEPLIDRVDAIATAALRQYPAHPWRVVGHSMGGLIWLELLQRHPEWCDRILSLTLISSPVGGADLGRLIDPLGWGIGIARDLGQDRRQLAEQIARRLPVQTIASDLGDGSDGTVPVQCSQFDYGIYTGLRGLRHDKTKNHPAVAAAIEAFWQQPQSPQQQNSLVKEIVALLRQTPGITDASYRGLGQAMPWAVLPQGMQLQIWRNPVGVHHVFLTAAGDCYFAGYVGWPHTAGLYRQLGQIRAQLQLG